MESRVFFAILILLQYLSCVSSAAPWPYLQIYPPVNGSDDRMPLYFALMLSRRIPSSIRALPGVQIALDYINNHPSILPGYTLHYTLSDSECDPTVTVTGVVQQLSNSPVKVGWIGSGCSTATEHSAELTQLYNITQLSCTSRSPVLTNRQRFRYYFQLRSTATNLNRGFLGIIDHYGWKKVGLITTLNSFFSAITDDLKINLAKHGIQYSETLVTQEGTGLRGDPFDPEMRIYVLIVSTSQARSLACQAFKKGLRYPRNQFLLLGESNYDWLKERNPSRDLGCTLEERQLTLRFALSPHPPNNEGDNATVEVGELSPVGFVEEFFRKARIPINEDVNLLDAIGERFPFYSEICYEATFTLAFALQNVIKELETDPLFNKEAAQLSGLSDGEVFTLDNFTYSNSAILKRMYYHINNTDFLGITGNRVHFDSNGIREYDRVLIMQYLSKQQNSGKDQERVATVIVESYEWRYSDSITEHLFWTDGIPNDGRTVQDIVTVSPAITAMYTTVGTIGIVFAITCSIFNFVFRKKKLIRLSSPKLNYIIIVGAILFYVSAISFVIPSTDPDAVVVFCNFNPIIVFTAYSMCFGTILMKMVRVWFIFNHPGVHKKYTLSDWHLFGAVMCFVGIDLVIILTFIVIQGFRDHLVANLSPNAELPREFVGPTEILHEHFVYACDADGRTALITLLYIYKIILQVIALILAFNTRKVKVKGLDDSKYIAAAIYITTIVLPVSFFASLTLWSHVNTFPAVLSTTHLFGATAILILVFVPRMIGLYRDPTGENVFQNVGATVTNENDLIALRRDVEQLRVSLHLAKKKGNTSKAAVESRTSVEGGMVMTAPPKKKPHVHFTSTSDSDSVEVVTTTQISNE